MDMVYYLQQHGPMEACTCIIQLHGEHNHDVRDLNCAKVTSPTQERALMEYFRLHANATTQELKDHLALQGCPWTGPDDKKLKVWSSNFKARAKTKQDMMPAKYSGNQILQASPSQGKLLD